MSSTTINGWFSQIKTGPVHWWRNDLSPQHGGYFTVEEGPAQPLVALCGQKTYVHPRMFLPLTDAGDRERCTVCQRKARSLLTQ